MSRTCVRMGIVSQHTKRWVFKNTGEMFNVEHKSNEAVQYQQCLWGSLILKIKKMKMFEVFLFFTSFFFVGSLARTHSIQTFYLRPFIEIKVVPKHFLAFLWRINMIYKSPTTIFRYCEIATSSIWTNIITLSEHWASAYLHFESGKMEMTVCLLEPFLNSFEYNVFFFFAFAVWWKGTTIAK